MLKKSVLLGAVIAVLAALSVPATAGAMNLYEGGVVVPVGSQLTLTQDGSLHLVTKSPTLGKIECESVMASGTLTENGSGRIKAEGIGGVAEPCTVNGKAGAKVTSILGSIESTTGDNGQATFNFVIDVPNVGTCTFQTPAGVPASLVFTTGTSTFKFNSSALEGLPELCGEATITGGLLVETAEGKGSPLAFGP